MFLESTDDLGQVADTRMNGWYRASGTVRTLVRFWQTYEGLSCARQESRPGSQRRACLSLPRRGWHKAGPTDAPCWTLRRPALRSSLCHTSPQATDRGGMRPVNMSATASGYSPGLKKRRTTFPPVSSSIPNARMTVRAGWNLPLSSRSSIADLPKISLARPSAVVSSPSHDTDQSGLVVRRASTPDVGPVVLAPEWVVGPKPLGGREHRHDIYSSAAARPVVESMPHLDGP